MDNPLETLEHGAMSEAGDQTAWGGGLTARGGGVEKP
jgi:hypothetical protein